MSRNSLACCTARHLRIRRLIDLSSQVLSIITCSRIAQHGHVAPAETSPICVAVMYLTLRTGCERHGRKNPLPLPFSKRSHIGNLRRIRKQGKGRSSKRKENRRLSFLFAPAAGAATSPPSADGESPAEVQRKTSRPLGANTLTQFVCPGFPVQKRSRPSGANTLTQFACPGQPVQKIREIPKKFSRPKRQQKRPFSR